MVKRGMIIGLILVSLILVTVINGCPGKDTSVEEDNFVGEGNCTLMVEPTSGDELCTGCFEIQGSKICADPPQGWVAKGRCICPGDQAA